MENFRPFESEKPKRKRKRKIENKGTLLGIPYYVILIGLIIYSFSFNLLLFNNSLWRKYVLQTYIRAFPKLL